MDTSHGDISALDGPLDLTVDPPAARGPDVDGDIGALHRRLTAAGLPLAGAGNLTAYVVGLRPATRAWTIREIRALMFLRELVRRDLIDR